MRHCSLRYRNDWFQVKNEDSNSLYSTQSNVFVSFSFLLFIYYFLARVNALISPKMPVPELQHEQVSLSSDTHAKKKKKIRNHLGKAGREAALQYFQILKKFSICAIKHSINHWNIIYHNSSFMITVSCAS